MGNYPPAFLYRKISHVSSFVGALLAPTPPSLGEDVQSHVEAQSVPSTPVEALRSGDASICSTNTPLSNEEETTLHSPHEEAQSQISCGDARVPTEVKEVVKEIHDVVEDIVHAIEEVTQIAEAMEEITHTGQEVVHVIEAVQDIAEEVKEVVEEIAQVEALRISPTDSSGLLCSPPPFSHKVNEVIEEKEEKEEEKEEPVEAPQVEALLAPTPPSYEVTEVVVEAPQPVEAPLPMEAPQAVLISRFPTSPFSMSSPAVETHPTNRLRHRKRRG